jgi:hypothetical protein
MLIDHFKLDLLVATSSLVVGGQAHAADPAAASAPVDANEVESLVVSLGVHGSQRTIADGRPPTSRPS